MNKYVFYNTITGNIEFIKKFTPEQAELNCRRNKNIQCITEDQLGPILNKHKVKIDLDSMTLVSRAQPQENMMAEVRHLRNLRITACDWTQGADSPLSAEKKAEWATYRQALRDITLNCADASCVKQVVWPTQPN